ncbi:MAG: ferrous iron transport protein A [Treponema sp.]|nr:ferrous iron transport protein A [Treponema sp.]
MMPLSFAKVGESNIIKKISGNDEVRRHLENLGFVVGSDVQIINTLAGNVIVKVKDSRIAINEDMARRIMI